MGDSFEKETEERIPERLEGEMANSDIERMVLRDYSAIDLPLALMKREENNFLRAEFPMGPVPLCFAPLVEFDIAQ